MIKCARCRKELPEGAEAVVNVFSRKACTSMANSVGHLCKECASEFWSFILGKKLCSGKCKNTVNHREMGSHVEYWNEFEPVEDESHEM